jgi:hypothetical protein
MRGDILKFSSWNVKIWRQSQTTVGSSVPKQNLPVGHSRLFFTDTWAIPEQHVIADLSKTLAFATWDMCPSHVSLDTNKTFKSREYGIMCITAR